MYNMMHIGYMPMKFNIEYDTNNSLQLKLSVTIKASFNILYIIYIYINIVCLYDVYFFFVNMDY